jgi:hypothetical protein
MVKQILSVSDPMIRGNLDYSFLFSLSGASTSYDNFLYAHYGNLCFVNQSSATVWDPFDLFPAPRLRKAIQAGALMAQRFDLWREVEGKNFSIIDFIGEQILRGRYCLVTLDEYFLEGKLSYRRVHFIHHQLAIGIDRAKQQIALMGYFLQGGKDYNVKWISFKSFVNAFLFKSHLLKRDAGMEIFAVTQYKCIVAFSVNANFDYKMDSIMLCSQIKCYLNSICSKNDVLHNKDLSRLKVSFGISTYDVLIEQLNRMLKSDDAVMMYNLRLLSEHKNFILNRTKYSFLQGFAPYDQEILDTLTAIFQQAKKLRLIFFSGVTPQGNRHEASRGVVSGLLQCRELEMKCYVRMLKSIIALHRY